MFLATGSRLLALTRRTLPALSLAAILASGCASGPASSSSVPSNTGDTTAANSTGVARGRLLNLNLTVNPSGQIDTTGRGYYLFLFNALGNPIEVTDLDTFTDFIRYDGHSFDWFHRNATLPNPGFQFILAGNLNQAGSISSDGKSIQVVLDAGDPTSLMNQFLVGSTFSMHVLTTDTFGGAIVGRALDTLGQGPDLDGDSLQTLTVQKFVGARSPLPQSYPVDPLTDFITQPDLPPDFPYANFDIQRFEVTVRG